jgi:outer membrane protein assembly factor BamB
MAVALILLLTIATAPFIGVGFAITGGESSGPVKRPIPVWTEDTPGPWTSIRYNESRGAYNEYSKAPNTSHILWIKDATLGGVVGGDVQESITGLNMINPVAVAMGRYWYAGGELRASKAESTPINGGGTLVCLDEYTGEEIYTTVYPGNASRWGIGTIVFDTSATLKTGGATIYTSCYGGVYATDAYSGLSMFNFRVATPNGTEILGPDGLKYYNGRIYVTDHSGGIGYWCYKAGDQERSVTPSSWIPDWYLPLASGDRPDYISDGILCSGRIGINATTGEILWTNTGFQGSGYGATGYGKIFTGGIDGNYYALDVKTGTQVWKSTIHAGLWGYGACVVNGKVYQGNYNGKFYCFDAETGNVEWEFNFNDYQANRGLSIPTVYTDRGWGWPLSAGPVGAEGKIYQVTDQHSPDQPRIDGHLLLCFDAESGQTLWTYPCSSSSHCMPMIADDMLFAINTYTGQVVCFGKGETAVEVSVAQGQISNGDYTWINGRSPTSLPPRRTPHA